MSLSCLCLQASLKMVGLGVLIGDAFLYVNKKSTLSFSRLGSDFHVDLRIRFQNVLKPTLRFVCHCIYWMVLSSANGDLVVWVGGLDS